MKVPTCSHPDHDYPKLLCGHPIPCPLHTVTMDATKDPPELRIPITATNALNSRRRLAEILDVISGESE